MTIEQKKRGRPSNKDKNKRSENRCDAVNRQGVQCGKVKGWGTDHLGEGKCKFHGGLTPIPTSIVVEDSLESMIAKYQDDPAIFDLRKDLATLRAFRDLFIKEYIDAENQPQNDVKQVAKAQSEKNDALYKLNVIINNIVRTSGKFFELVNKSNFALTIAQARQVREQMKLILVEELNGLKISITSSNPELEDLVDATISRIAERLTTELIYEHSDRPALTGGS